MAKEQTYKLGEERAFYINTPSFREGTALFWGNGKHENTVCMSMNASWGPDWISWGDKHTNRDYYKLKARNIVGVFKCKLIAQSSQQRLWELVDVD